MEMKTPLRQILPHLFVGGETDHGEKSWDKKVYPILFVFFLLQLSQRS